MIAAIILAAGESRRMGQPKMLMPWGSETVLGHVLITVQSAGIQDILVVTGGARVHVEAFIKDEFQDLRTVYNPEYGSGEMLSSIQCGLRAITSGTRAGLICLGDQPQIREESVKLVCAAFLENESLLVAPSYLHRRGHPWLVARPLWDELLAMNPTQTPRDFLNAHAAQIQYVQVDSPSVIEDLDTPEDHRKFKPRE
jgi:molybdenum cofactor cytidylyltransferase